MHVVATGPLPASSLLWQPRRGTWVLTVVAKATFELAPGESPLAAIQDPICEHDERLDDDPAKSLHAATDLVPLKPTADVVLVGFAYAPAGTPVRSLLARLVVADVDKTVEVVQDRAFTQTGVLQEGQRFSRMSLAYEHAAGGPDSWNPAGVRRDVRDRYGRTAVPNLQRPVTVVTGPADFIEPVGFGPIAPEWPGRLDRLGPGARAWAAHAPSEAPLPEDLDRAYFNVAPVDQRTAELRDNERIVLGNLHPAHPHLVTSLPGVRPRAVAVGRPGGLVEVPMRADTLAIDTARQVCTVTWRGQLPLASAGERGRVMVAVERPGSPLTLEAIAVGGDPPLPPARPIAVGGDPPLPPARPIAVGGDPPLPPARPIAVGGDPPLPPARPIARSAADEGSMTLRLDDRAPTERLRAVLPFAPGEAERPAPAPPARPPAPGRPPPLPPRARPAGAPPAPRPASIGDMTLAFDGPPPETPPGQVAATPFRAADPALAAPQIGGLPAAPPPRSDLAPPAPPPIIAPPLPAATPWGVAQSFSPEVPAPPTIEPVAPPEPVPPPQLSIGMMLAASNAAAAAAATATTTEAPAPPAPVPSTAGSDVLLLVWLDRKRLPRMVKKPAWRRILDALQDEPIDPEDDDPALSTDHAEIEDRTHAFVILDRAAATDLDGLHAALARAAGKRGQRAAPLELVEGDLTLPLDEVATLEATVSATTPLAGGDEALSATLATARDFLGSPGAARATVTAEALTGRIREAFAQGKRSLSVETLDAQVQRALLAQRAYQKRKVLGGPHLRGLLHLEGPDRPPVVLYLPEAMVDDLPLAARFRVRTVAEVHVAVDEREEHALSLRAAALGRVVVLPRR